MSIETVAEGIESHSQAEMLAREGCDAGQGFYFHPPLPAAEAEKLITTGR
jgi:EAL domain-containing protein (putative c-di-GMP-specific phosphodiesterase class I)